MENKPAIRTAPAANKPSALAVMASRLQVDPDKMMATLRETVFKKATNEEMLALVVVANAYDLNPFLKEIYAFPAKGGGIVPIVSVDGWNKMLLRQPDYDGMDWESTDDSEGKPYSCTAIIYVKGRSHPVKITEYFAECYRNTEPWNNMPRRMLRNRTLCQASRVAFGFAGIHDPDEAENIIEVTTTPPPKRIGPAVTEPAAIAPATDEPSDADKLAKVITDAGYSFDQFANWAEESGQIPDCKSLPGFADIKPDAVKRLLRAITGMLKGLETTKALSV